MSHRGVDRIRQLDKLIKYKLATDFIVYTPTEVEQRLKVGDPFIKNRGRTLLKTFTSHLDFTFWTDCP